MRSGYGDRLGELHEVEAGLGVDAEGTLRALGTVPEGPEIRRGEPHAWYVLSAKYHLLEPDGSPIEPYDETLTNAGVEERREWRRTVVEQLRERDLLTRGNTLVIHAEKSYYVELLPLLDDEPVDVEIPTEGLQMGKTLSWYDERS